MNESNVGPLMAHPYDMDHISILLYFQPSIMKLVESNIPVNENYEHNPFSHQRMNIICIS